MPLHIDSPEPPKLDDGAGCAEKILPGFDVNSRRVKHCRFHLARDEPLPDEFVEAILFIVEIRLQCRGCAQRDTRPHRFVRVLRSLFAPIVHRPCRQIFCAVSCFDELARGGECILGNARGVGAHVGDKPNRTFTAELHPFIELLRDAHRPFRRKSEFSGCLLLQTTGDKGGHGPLSPLLFLHLFDDIGVRLRIGREFLRPRRIDEKAVVVNLSLLFPDAVQFGKEARLRGRAFCWGQRGGKRPIFLWFERLNFCFAFADEAHSNGLHPASTQPRFDAAPQNRANLVSNESVQDAPCLLRVDKCHVNLPWTLNGIQDSPFRDFVIDDAIDRFLRLFEFLGEVPTDGFTLPVRVCGEIDGVHLLR